MYVCGVQPQLTQVHDLWQILFQTPINSTYCLTLNKIGYRRRRRTYCTKLFARTDNQVKKKETLKNIICG